MAAIARLLPDVIVKGYKEESKQGQFHQQIIGFQRILSHNINAEEFADMYVYSRLNPK